MAMCRDQGHRPVKALAIEPRGERAVGLPVIRMSVDYGTAFGIAAKAITDSWSMVESLHQAGGMAARPSEAV